MEEDETCKSVQVAFMQLAHVHSCGWPYGLAHRLSTQSVMAGEESLHFVVERASCHMSARDIGRREVVSAGPWH